MKVLHVLDHSLPHLSGYAIRSHNILSYQIKNGIEVYALTSPKHGNISKAEKFNQVTYKRTNLNYKLNISYLNEFYIMLNLFMEIHKNISLIKPDIIHAHSPLLNGWPSYYTAKYIRIPFIYEIRAFWEDAAVDHGTTTENSFRYRLTKQAETRLAKSAAVVVTLSETMKKELSNRGVIPEKIEVIPNAVNIKKFNPIPPSKELENKYDLRGKINIGFIGSFYHYEGIDLLVKAFEEIRKLKENVVLMLIGDGFELDNIKKLVKKSPFSKDIKILGRIPHELIQEYYSLIDIMVFPRRKLRLTELVCPLKPLEAMAMQKAVIGSNVGGIKEFIVHERNGLLFEAGNIQHLVQQLLLIIENEEFRNKLKVQARKDVIERFCWSVVVKKYLKIYEHALANNSNH